MCTPARKDRRHGLHDPGSLITAEFREIARPPWIWVVVRGVVAILFGILVLVWPGMSIAVLVIMVAILAIIWGITLVVLGIQLRKAGKSAA